MALVTANQFQLAPNISGAVSQGLNAYRGAQQAGLQRSQFERQGEQQKVQADRQALQDRFKSVATAAVTAKNLPTDADRVRFLQNRVADLNSKGIDSSDTQEALGLYAAGKPEQANALINSAVQTGIDTGILKSPAVASIPAETAAFEGLTKGLSGEQKKEAILIKLGLSPRAVGSAIQTITAEGIEDQVGKASAVIKQREKFGEMTGSSRAKAIDSGFEKISKINSGIGNIDRAISLINSGAGVGAIERFLPSFKAASVALDNVQKSMALDVIGSVTFGALSEGELNLAKEVALPTGLDAPQLIDHLQKRKVAQEKLRNYFQEQIQFLDQGGTVAGFLRSKDDAAEQQPAEGVPMQDPGQVMVDANGNRARVFQDGRVEEL